MPPRTTHLRADAGRNRERILQAARSMFSDAGLTVSMRSIARRAQVGPATLYRHFPAKQELIDAAFGQELETCRRIVVEGCHNPDPWRGFTSVVLHLIELNVHNSGFVDAFTSAGGHENNTIAQHRRELLRMLTELGRRARTAGELRTDFATDDLVIILLAGRGLSALAPNHRHEAAQRFANLVIDGLSSGAHHQQPLTEGSAV